MVLIAGPSGAGKTTIVKYLENTFPDSFKEAVSHTTRPIRPGEINGVHYHFVDKKEFERMIENNELIEYMKIYDNYYGLSKKEIESILAEGKIPLIIVYPTALPSYKEYCEEIGCLKLFFTAPKDVLIERLKARGDSPEQLQKRLSKLDKELEMEKELKDQFDNVIVCVGSIEEVAGHVLDLIEQKKNQRFSIGR